jgi:hypothetical protein
MVQAMLGQNWLAVVVTTVILMVIGFVWYTVFAKQWSAYTGWTREKIATLPQNQMMMSYGITIVAALLQTIAIGTLLRVIGITGITTALGLGALVWLGFNAAPSAAAAAFEHRPWGLVVIQNGLYLVNFLVAAVILTVWK